MEQKTILLVEDTEAIRSLYEMAFKDAGINVLSAPTGETGVALALTHHPDLILMDIEMPGMDGHTAVEKIREDAWGRTAKVIYLTNHSAAEDVFTAVSQKSDDYIVKANTDIHEVVNRVRTAMF